MDTTTMKILNIFAGEAYPKACNDVSECTADTDCQACTGVCSNAEVGCSTDADCQGGTCGSYYCGDGTTCSSNADCAAKTCTTTKFWSDYESHLDKTRAGCSVN